MTPKFVLILCGFASRWAAEILAALGVSAESPLVLGIVGIINIMQESPTFFFSQNKH